MNNTPSKIVRDFFTSEEWDAIDSALCDFQDYGEKESDLAKSVGNKIYNLFKEDLK